MKCLCGRPRPISGQSALCARCQADRVKLLKIVRENQQAEKGTKAA
jgi:hypothetical protein